MDEATRKVCEDILREKILSLQSDYEHKIAALEKEHQAAIAQVREDEAVKRQALEIAHKEKLDALQKEFCQKTKALEEEINFLNERHDSQRLMLSDTLSYVQKLEKELDNLKKLIAKGDQPVC